MYENHATYVLTHLTRRAVEEINAKNAERVDQINAARKVIEEEFPEARAELDARFAAVCERLD